MLPREQYSDTIAAPVSMSSKISILVDTFSQHSAEVDFFGMVATMTLLIKLA